MKSYWSRANVTCMKRRSFHEWCTEDIECLANQNLICDEPAGHCECPIFDYQYFSHINKTCQPKNTWHEECITTYGCINVIGLECSNEVCDCVNLDEKYQNKNNIFLT